MDTAADSSSSSSSNTHSPQFRRNSRSLSSPVSHIVRSESEAATGDYAPSSPSPPFPSAARAIPPPEPSDRSPPKAAVAENPPAVEPSYASAAVPQSLPQSDSPDQGDDGSAATAAQEKKPVWNKPSNGLIEAGPVMGAVSWPALSEAAKPSSKSSSSDSLKALPVLDVSAPPGPVISSLPPQPIINNPNPGSFTNQAVPTRQKSMKRASTNSNSGAPLNGGPARPTSAEMPQISLDKPIASESSPKDLTNRNSSNWVHGLTGGGFSQQSHGGDEHHRNYGGNRRGNNGGGGGGGRPHHNNYGNRRGQERGGYEWNHRPFGGGRDVQMQPQHRAMSRPYIQPPPPGLAPFISPPPPVHPLGSPMGFPNMPAPVYYVPAPPPPESLGGMPFFVPHPMFFAAPDPQLRSMLAKQIDYYFSSENLCKDIFLRQNMDEEGWVPISLIANFNRVKQLTNNIQFILETVRMSTMVEVQGDKIRRLNDWMNWLLPPAPNQSYSSTMPNYDSLPAHMRSVRMDERTSIQNSTRGTTCNEVVFNKSSSRKLNS